MAGGQERILRRRIRSVQATKKITRAFELIAASQIVRAQNRIAANRPYRQGMQRIVVEAAKGDPAAARKLLGAPEDPAHVTVVAIVGDRGLSGAYNSSVLRATERQIAELTSRGATVALVTVGRKAQAYFRFRGQAVARSFTGMADRPTFEDARQVALAVGPAFMGGETDQVLVVSTRFHSAGRQTVEVEPLLPLPLPDLPDEPAPTAGGGYTEFEPEVEQLLAVLSPRALESELFSALLEASAAEHTARQRAMAAATENADELITSLSRTMNRARQDAITTEIMEIVGGAEALRAKGASA